MPSVAPETAAYLQEILDHRTRWEEKPALRAVYADLFSRMRHRLSDAGPTLEIGAGAGTARPFLPPGAWSADVFHTPWVHVVLDAREIPFTAGSLGNIIMVDTLHHVSAPLAFLDEVERVLAPGGRLVLCEPYLSAASYVFYRWIHREGANPAWDPSLPPEGPVKGAFANQAAESILFGRRGRGAQRDSVHGKRRFGAKGSLSLVAREPFGLATYVLSGGFQRWSLVPAALSEKLLGLESRLPRALLRVLGWRVVTVLEKAC